MARPMPEARLKARKGTKAVAPAKKAGLRWWIYVVAGVAALFVAFQVYAPALNGPFVFDDTLQPYHVPNYPNDLHAWISGVRPLLMFSYWMNYQFSTEPFSYHVINVLIHVFNSLLVFFIVRRFLAPTQRDPLAAFAGAVFLLHPIQTESVAYIAGRSECLSVLFLLAAFTVFLYRRSPTASWKIAIAVFALFGAAVATKEHTLVLPGLLLLTDYYWNPGFSLEGIRRNWRIYLPIAAGGIAGLAFVARILAHAPSAGFGLKDLTWYRYFFTECRAFFSYLRLLVFPAGQNLDYDYPVSHTIVEHGAIFGLLVILLLLGAAIYYRRRYSLASYGSLVFLLLLAPTSSIVPIKDPLAERRLYMPMIGALLVAVAALQYLRFDRRKLAIGMSAVAVALAFLTWQRNQVWASDIALWEDTVHKSPGKARVHFQLAHTYYANGRYQDAVKQYAEAARLQQLDYSLLVDWGLAYDDAGQPDQALDKLRQAAAMEPSAHVYTQIARVYAKRSQWAEALTALAQAEKLNPNYDTTYYYRGGIRAKTGDFASAVADYQRALAFDPSLEPAVRDGLAYAEQQARMRR
jgi:tetratricopeptide (TPR) repeat protein